MAPISFYSNKSCHEKERGSQKKVQKRDNTKKVLEATRSTLSRPLQLFPTTTGENRKRVGRTQLLHHEPTERERRGA